MLFLQSHLFLIFVALTYNDSRILPHNTCQISRHCLCEWLWVSSSAPGTSLGSSGSPGRFLFCMGKIVTTALPNLLPPRHIDYCHATHCLHWEFCGLHVSSHQNFPLWAQLYQYVFCKKPLLFSSSSRYPNLGSDTVLTRTWSHFCSRPHW